MQVNAIFPVFGMEHKLLMISKCHKLPDEHAAISILGITYGISFQEVT